MFSKKKYNAENNKVGKNDNVDVGNNKNNKSKKINKHWEINTINYDPNQVIVSLIKEIAKKEIKIHKKIRVLKKCKECKKIINKVISNIDNSIEKLSEKYDLEKQWLSFKPIIKDVSPLIKDLYKLKESVYDFCIHELCCKKHQSLYETIELERIELKSLKESISSFNNKM